MIVSEVVTYNGVEYDKTYSSIGMKIQRDGQIYDEAIDPKGSGRVYTETDIPISDSMLDNGGDICG